MPTKTCAAANGLPQGDLLRVLRALARKGTVAQCSPNAAAICLTISTNGEPHAGQLHEITNEAWQQALQARWLTATATDREWRLTRRGRHDLKRALTREITPSHAKHSNAKPTRCTAGLTKRPQVADRSSPLAWLAQRKDKAGRPFLAQQEVDAGERLSADFWFAQMTPRVTSNWDFEYCATQTGRANTASGHADNVAAAGERVRQALAAVGADAADMLVDVCCYMKGLEALERESGWPKRSAKIVLKFALGLLARHYGLTPRRNSKTPAVLHWGAEDYRPKIEADNERQTEPTR